MKERASKVRLMLVPRQSKSVHTICYSADYTPEHRKEMIAVNIHTGTVEAVSSEPGPTAAGIAARSVAAFSHLLTVTQVYIQVAFIDIWIIERQR